jgi:hypothetical protein
LGANALATAATLKGTVTNGTTGKAVARRQVLILSAAKGKTGSGITDSGGRFSIAVEDPRASHVVRVVHQGVAYQKMARPGVQSVKVQVYDVAQKLDGVSATDVHRFQTDGERLQAVEEIAVRNASNPPRTLLNNRALAIQLPPEAEVVGGKVQFGGGRPLTSKPIPGTRKGEYYFPFPLHPGETRFAVAYLLPYRGEAVIEPRISYPLAEFRVVLPGSMQFEAKTAGRFEPMPEQSEANAQVIAAMNPAQPLVFRISGTGTVVARQGGRPQAQPSERARPGGGPQAPAAGPDPLHSLRWLTLGGLAVILAAFAAGVARARARKLKEKQS